MRGGYENKIFFFGQKLVKYENKIKGGLTDRWTDGPTDIVTYRVACTQLKIDIKQKVNTCLLLTFE